MARSCEYFCHDPRLMFLQRGRVRHVVKDEEGGFAQFPTLCLLALDAALPFGQYLANDDLVDFVVCDGYIVQVLDLPCLSQRVMDIIDECDPKWINLDCGREHIYRFPAISVLVLDY